MSARRVVDVSRGTEDAGKTVHPDDVGQKLARNMALQDDGLQSGERSLADELAAEKMRKGAKDALLNEAAHILSDQAGLLKAGAGLAARNESAAR